MLSFWRDVQYHNFPQAYRRMTRQLRSLVRYDRFSKAFTEAQPLFLYRPRVQSVETEGDRAAVYLLLQVGPKPSAKDAPMAFNIVRERGRWSIATDPRNVLGTAAGASLPDG